MIEPGTARKIVIARKYYWCDENYGHDRRISPGDLYVRVTIFPNHDLIGDLLGRKPYVLRHCAPCEGLEA